ncbi:MAG: hypothetical protein ACOCUG_00210 [Halanaerobium sp.]
MEINQKRVILFAAFILLCLIFLTQLLLTKDLFEESGLLQIEINKQREQNKILENKYQKLRKDKKLNNNLKRAGIKESTADILEKLKFFKLQLIDFSSDSNELNLNLRGNFHSILQFIKYLESQMTGIELVEFKIKSSGNSLFLFLKLKNELI